MSDVSTPTRYVTVRGLANGAQLRTASFDGTDHIVVPVVALLGDVVVWPMNSEGPEFVPGQELAVAPASWNGRPVLPDHPHEGAGSANDPVTLSSQRFGYMFNTRYEDKKLKTEAWLDPSKAEAVGPVAVSVIERCRRGEVVEVSVGAWITAEKVQGVSPTGESYVARWRDIIPDHLAMLGEGVTGACSVEMGCGAPRNLTAKGKPMSKANPTFLQRVLSSFGLRSAKEDEGASVYDLSYALSQALFGVEPGFVEVLDFFPASQTVIYAVMPEGEYVFYRRSYTLSAEGGFEGLDDDREQVEYDPQWKAVSANTESTETPEVIAAKRLSVSMVNEPVSAPDSLPVSTLESTPGGTDTMCSVAALASRLISSGKAPFAETDRLRLEALSATQLESLNEAYQTGEQAPTNTTPTTPATITTNAAPSTTTTPEAPRVLTEAEQIALLPPSVRAMAERFQAQENAHRAGLITYLSSAQQSFPADHLQKMSTDDLTRLADVVRTNTNAVNGIDPHQSGASIAGLSFDYSARPLPITTDDDSTYDTPKPYTKARAKKTGTEAAN